MKTFTLFVLAAVSLLFFSCEEEQSARITVKNEISNIRMRNVYFEGTYLSGGSLLPGQSIEQVIYGYEEDWPKQGPVSFVMEANGGQVYLITDTTYVLQPGDELELVITDDTPVSSF